MLLLNSSSFPVCDGDGGKLFWHNRNSVFALRKGIRDKFVVYSV